MAEQATFPWMLKDAVSVSEAARILGLSAQMVRHLCNTGQLPHFRMFGRRDRAFSRQDVLDLKASRELNKLIGDYFRPRTTTVRYATAARVSR
jgi:excisionase family DNA binding protein